MGLLTKHADTCDFILMKVFTRQRPPMFVRAAAGLSSTEFEALACECLEIRKRDIRRRDKEHANG